MSFCNDDLQGALVGCLMLHSDRAGLCSKKAGAWPSPEVDSTPQHPSFCSAICNLTIIH